MARSPSSYSIVLHLKTQSLADKLYNAFNGRFFSEDPEMQQHGDGEAMHTVFLSEPTLFRPETEGEVGLSEHENY